MPNFCRHCGKELTKYDKHDGLGDFADVYHTTSCKYRCDGVDWRSWDVTYVAGATVAQEMTKKDIINLYCNAVPDRA